MFSASFNIIANALEVYKKALDIRNRNVANSQNENYVAQEPLIQSDLYSGVRLADVRREQNLYLVNMRNEKLSYVSYLSERSDILESVENVFMEMYEGKGLNDYLNRFFEAYQELMKDPANEGARSGFIASSESLLATLRTRLRDLDRVSQDTDYQLRAYVEEVNSLIEKIYRLNREITFKYAYEKSRGGDYKTLLDRRDEYLKKLSEYLPVKFQEDEVGRVKVYTVKGFVLVDYQDNYFELGYDAGAITWKDGSQLNPYIDSGKIGALLRVKEDLAEVESKLDSLARALLEVRIPVGTDERPVFTGTGIRDLSVSSTLEADLSSLDFGRTDEYAQLSYTWWENARNSLLGLTDFLASTIRSLRDEYEVEEALYRSLEMKLLERQGVSVDEEFMEILKLQRNYEAVAQIVARIDEMLQTTLNMI
ncbi:MAG: flagellar hook-associated protein FlgK [Aquificae bacterium]|nr:flagellar hook-associated protein FlgK [Aquificota bacterium]